jgi:hypothetical protein
MEAITSTSASFTNGGSTISSLGTLPGGAGVVLLLVRRPVPLEADRRIPYERSAGRYAAVRQTIGEPDPFRLRHRLAIKQVVAEPFAAR